MKSMNFNETFSSTNGRCLNVTAQNITLDCSGYSLSGANNAGSIAIYSDQFNTTVINCNISNFATGISIYSDSADYANITNNTITQTYASSCHYTTGVCNAIFINGADNATITYNSLTSGSSGYGINLLQLGEL